MSRKLKRRLVWLSIVALGLFGPILLMSLCTGWNEGTMAVQSCRPDWPVLRDLANIFYAFLLMAAFMAGLPLLIYVALCVLFAFVAARVLVR